MAKAIEPFEKKAAETRRATPNVERVNFTPSTKGKSSDKVAESVGMSRPTLEKAKPPISPGRGKVGAKAEPTFHAPTLAELGLSKKESSTAQALASVEAWRIDRHRVRDTVRSSLSLDDSEKPHSQDACVMPAM